MVLFPDSECDLVVAAEVFVEESEVLNLGGAGVVEEDVGWEEVPVEDVVRLEVGGDAEEGVCEAPELGEGVGDLFLGAELDVLFEVVGEVLVDEGDLLEGGAEFFLDLDVEEVELEEVGVVHVELDGVGGEVGEVGDSVDVADGLVLVGVDLDLAVARVDGFAEEVPLGEVDAVLGESLVGTHNNRYKLNENQ